MNRKLRKLLRDPKRFFLDSRLLASSADSAAPRAAPRAAPEPPRIDIQKPESSPDVLEPSPEFVAEDSAAGPVQLADVTLDSTLPAPTPTDKSLPEQAITAASKPADAPLDSPPITGIEGYEEFVLHGQNWLDGTAKPVAVLWGFAPWQRGFVTRYLPEYRAAFVEAGKPWKKLAPHLDRMEEVRFIVWRYSETEVIREYAKRRALPFARMDDGFLRSVTRGWSKHASYSMILDESGLYSNPASPSDLESLLNFHDFSSSRSFLQAAPALMQLHRKLGIGKYMAGSFMSSSRLLGPKGVRRVLVAGDSPRVAAFKSDAADPWTARRLVELAVAENPGAQIIFRPHPNDIKTYRTETEAAAELAPLCRVLAHDVQWSDVLRSVDQVYVDSSLAGMEALIHGVPVTVVGTPFYSGWGLTDDRQAVSGRERKLSLEELYCAAYLLYPKYLADLDDPLTGCLATMIRMVAERRQILDASVTPELVERHGAGMALTDYWPTLLRAENLEELAAKHELKLLRVFSTERAFADSKAERFQRSVASLLVGQFRKTPVATAFLRPLSMWARTDVYRQVLLDLWRVNPSAEILEQLAWCCEQAGDVHEARALLEHLTFGGELKKDPDSPLPFAPADYPRVIRLARFEVGQKKFERAEQLFNWLLVSGCLQPEIFVGLSTIARLRFDFKSSALLLGLARRLHPTWKQGRLHVHYAQACGLAGDPYSTLESMARACLANPQYIGSARAIQAAWDRQIGPLPYTDAMHAAIELNESDDILSRAKALIAHERPADAERLLLKHLPRVARSTRYALTLSLAYSYSGKLADAKALVSTLLTESPTLPVYQEALRLAVMSSDYDWGDALLGAARELHLEVGDAYERKITLGLGRIGTSYRSFRKMKAAGMLRGYLGSKYVQSLQALDREPGATNLVVAAFGPGDEIRFTTTYPDIHAAAGKSRVAFTCDPRLAGLLRRHYTQLEFIPTARIRSLARLEHFRNYDQLPGSDLHIFFDNHGWAEAKAASRIILVSDALGDVIEDYPSFRGRPCMKADPALVQNWRARLPHDHRGGLLVGLSWRSSLMSYVRNEHYLAVEELSPLFEVEGVRFVNLQYDECRHEVAWVQERFPGRLLNFADLDQFNDLDGVAALMECLDLVISPATAVVELAGALGRPTLLLSNSSELQWRKIPGSRVDTWHNSILHVEAPVLGDKQGLVRQLVSELRQAVATSQRTSLSLA